MTVVNDGMCFFNHKHFTAAQEKHAYLCDCGHKQGATGSFDVCSEKNWVEHHVSPTRISLCYTYTLYSFFQKKSFCQSCSAASVDVQHSAFSCITLLCTMHGLCSVDHGDIMHGSSCVLSYSILLFTSTRIYTY